MNAQARPQRRRKSSLASEHPAYPPTQVPGADQDDSPTAGSVPEHPPDTTPSRADASARARPARGDEARARKLARDAAYGWASARRKTDKRLDEWATEMERARAAGSLPGVLREYIVEAAERVGLDPSDVPAEVWHAAGLTPDRFEGNEQ